MATSYGFSPASTTPSWRLVDVPPGARLTDLADRLQNQGIIRSKVCFLAAARISGESNYLQPGQYRLSPSMSPMNILDDLAKGMVATEWVVIPEGSSLRQIGLILEKHHLANQRRFDAALRHGVSVYRRPLHLTASTLEGYLFPDTYKIPRTMNEAAIVKLMVERFKQVKVERLLPTIKKKTNGLSFADTMILASLVEKEAAKNEERAHIAGVLLNRLRGGIKLQCDASIEYILPQHKAHLTHQDLAINSPYNTYEHRGLPPAPICCPGLDSIEAALRPQATHDMYYVATPDGYHLFSKTLAEHDQDIVRAEQIKADQGL